LQQRAQVYHLNGHVYGDVNAAISEAKNKAAKKDLIMICGSVFLVGEVNY